MKIYKKDKILDGNTRYKGLRFDLDSGKRIELVSGWSLKKGDWWYEGTDPSKAKFISTNKKVHDDGVQEYGLYIGRLAIVVMKGKIDLDS